MACCRDLGRISLRRLPELPPLNHPSARSFTRSDSIFKKSIFKKPAKVDQKKVEDAGGIHIAELTGITQSDGPLYTVVVSPPGKLTRGSPAWLRPC